MAAKKNNNIFNKESGHKTLFFPYSILLQISFSTTQRAFGNQIHSLASDSNFCFTNKLGNHC